MSARWNNASAQHYCTVIQALAAFGKSKNRQYLSATLGVAWRVIYPRCIVAMVISKRRIQPCRVFHRLAAPIIFVAGNRGCSENRVVYRGSIHDDDTRTPREKLKINSNTENQSRQPDKLAAAVLRKDLRRCMVSVIVVHNRARRDPPATRNSTW